MIFDFDEDMILNTITDSLEDAGYSASEEQFIKIVDAIDESMPNVIEVITYGMMVHWRKEALKSGTGWGQKYAQIIDAKITNGVGEVFLDEKMIDKSSGKPNFMFAKMIEEGVKSWSIKDALMKSDKVKVGPSGIPYITILFPISTPRSKNQGTMMSKFGKREMTREMYKIVKSGGKLKSGLISAGGKDLDVSGLTRFNTRKLHNQYGIFRRITKDTKGFEHPGRGASPVFPSVEAEVNKRVQDVLSAFCKNIVKEYTTST